MDSVTVDAAKPRKTKPKGRHPHNALAAAFVRTAPVGRHADGNGRYLYVQRTGTRSWIQRLVIRGRKHELGLGSVHLVSLAEAREQALANRKLARSGGDPLSDKRRAQAVPTFAEAAAAVVEQKQAGWRSPRQAKEGHRSLERFAFPRIGSRPVSEVTSADVLEILSPIWHTKAPTAKSVRQRIRAVLEWAVAMEYRTDNPCDRIGPVLDPQRDVVRHMRALPHRDVASALETVRVSRATRALKLAFDTAARSGEVRLATCEIDTRGHVWTIPATRMKANRAHRVPLSERALEILAAARTLADGNPLVFPNRWGNPVKDSFLSQMRLGGADHPREVGARDGAGVKSDAGAFHLADTTYWHRGQRQPEDHPSSVRHSVESGQEPSAWGRRGGGGRRRADPPPGAADGRDRQQGVRRGGASGKLVPVQPVKVRREGEGEPPLPPRVMGRHP